MNQNSKLLVETNRDIVTAFCGYGNPEKAKIFFMGIEEHSEIDENHLNDFAKRKLDCKNDYFTICNSALLNYEPKNTEKIQAEIYRKIYNKNDISDAEIFNNEIHCFNYYPLGSIKEKSFYTNYEKRFGFKNKDESNKYFETSIRKLILQKFINDNIINQKKIFIVLGQRIWDKAKQLIPKENFISKELDVRINRKQSYEFNSAKSIYFLYHPSNGWLTTKEIEKIDWSEIINMIQN